MKLNNFQHKIISILVDFITNMQLSDHFFQFSPDSWPSWLQVTASGIRVANQVPYGSGYPITEQL